MSAIPKSMVKKVLQRDLGVCVLHLEGCLVTATVADHRVNRGQGGSRVLNDPANLLAACGLCNGRKEDATGSELDSLYFRGVKVKPDATHEKSLERARRTAVVYPDGVWRMLTSAGERIDMSVIA